jgi:hypothetical protein
MNQDLDVFSQFMTDALCLHKPDGRVFENVKACVSGNGAIAIEDVSLPIEVGDRFTRNLPSGLTESFMVDDPGYRESFGPIAAHYRVKAHRAGTERSLLRGATYNVTGPNARVNINSHDHSTNTVAFEPAPVFADLRKAVVEAVGENGERAKLLAGIEAMENGHRTHAFVDQYKDFITLAANHMTIVAPFLPALSALLSGH